MFRYKGTVKRQKGNEGILVVRKYVKFNFLHLLIENKKKKKT